jgi:hypothetical protein
MPSNKGFAQIIHNTNGKLYLQHYSSYCLVLKIHNTDESSIYMTIYIVKDKNTLLEDARNVAR